MALHYLDRTAYRHSVNRIHRQTVTFGQTYVLPKVAPTNWPCQLRQLVADVRQHVSFDALAVAVNTGGTLAGILTGLDGEHHAVEVAKH
jgi:1-aminocyclopropane-1-carboxylate deaminase/D-cysteine desulfhydrase-like pyridoxal-dependent ACC family enzyme